MLNDRVQDVTEKLLKLGIQPQRVDPRTVIWDVCQKVFANYRRHEKIRGQVDAEVGGSILGSVVAPEARLNRTDDWCESCCRIATLPKAQLHAVYLRQVMELSVTETAALLGITEAAVRVADSRGMATLKANHRLGRPHRRLR